MSQNVITDSGMVPYHNVFTVFPHLFISTKNAFSDLICSVGFLSMNNMETRGPECSAEFLEVEAVGLF